MRVRPQGYIGRLVSALTCIRCGAPKDTSFQCPCDLEHGLCANCRQAITRLDCAHITRVQGACGPLRRATAQEAM